MRHAVEAMLAALILCGCSGEYSMTPTSKTTIDQHQTVFHGIVAYRPLQVIEVDAFTQTPSAADKSVLTGECEPVLTRKAISIADTTRPYVISYKPGLLETYTFNVTLTADGILTGINSQSTPDQGKTIDNLMTAATGVAALAAREAPPIPGAPVPPRANNPKCTVTPAFYGYEQPPSSNQILPFGTTPKP